MKIIESESGMAISVWHLYHHAMSYSAFCGILLDVMLLVNHGSYIWIKFLRLFGRNEVLMDNMSFCSSKYQVLY